MEDAAAGRTSDPDDPSEAVLAEVLRDLDRGVDPDPAALLARHPGHEEAVERILRALSDYQSMALSEAGGTPAPDAPSSPVEDLPAGAVLGDFLVERRIARGGMGVVYRARQRSLGDRPVALKVLPAESADEASRRRFRREALLAASLHHPHIAEIHGFGATDERIFYAMRLVEGPSLREVLARLVSDPGRARRPEVQRAIVRRIAEVAAALAEVHAAGLVHRDVKPGNILLEGGAGDEALVPDHPAVLVDFGLVREQDPELCTRTGGSSATPAYASPEQLLGGEMDERSDVFSLGATLHDLLSARAPGARLQASAGLEPLEQIVPGIDRDLAAVVAKAVDPMLQWRYADARAFHADLVAWLGGRPVAARRQGAFERARRWIRSPVGWGTSMGAAALVVLVGFASSRVSSWVRGASFARERLEALDLKGTLDALPGIPRAVLGRYPDLKQLRDRMHANDILFEAYEHIRDGDYVAYYRVGRRELREKGLRADPTLLRFLLASLEQAAGRFADGATWDFVTAEALDELTVALARGPRTSDPDPQTLEVLRRFYARLFEVERLPRPQRLAALAGLAECGSTEDFDRILEWISTGVPAGTLAKEDIRQGLVSLGAILERTMRGTPSGVDGARPDLRRAIATTRLVLRHQGCPNASPLDGRLNRALERLLEGLVFFAAKGTGPDRGDVEQVVSEAERDPSCTLTVSSMRVRLLSAAGHLTAGDLDTHVRVWREVRTGAASAGAGSGSAEVVGNQVVALRDLAGDLGWPCGAHAGTELSEHARSLLVVESSLVGLTESEMADVLAKFDEARSKGARAREGEPETDPQPATFVTNLETQAGGDTSLWDRDEPTVSGVLQEWVFCGRPAFSPRGVGEPTLHEVYELKEGDGGGLWSVGLYTPGVSHLRLPFVIGPDQTYRRLDLVIRAQKALEDAFPLGGTARLDVTLDDEHVVPGLLVGEVEPRDYRIPLRSFALDEGTRWIGIRLGAGSSSRCRIHRVMLCESPKSPREQEK